MTSITTLGLSIAYLLKKVDTFQLLPKQSLRYFISGLCRRGVSVDHLQRMLH
jgi:hypothetical protein